MFIWTDRQMIKYDIEFSNYIDSKCQLQNVGFQNFPSTVFSTYIWAHP